MNRSLQNSSFFIALVVLGLITVACGSSRRAEFQLKQEDYAVSQQAEMKTSVYLTSTRSIDSADVSSLFVDVWKTEAEDYPREIRLYVRVMDSSGNFITNMADPYYRGSGDYRRYWSGIREKIGTVDTVINKFTVREFGDLDSIPYSIMLALDHGGSMQGTIESLQQAAEMFLNLKRSFDRIGVMKFDNKTVIEVPMTADRRQIQALYKKDGLEGYGLYTSLFDATKEAILQLRNEPPTNPRVLVLFTDGEDNNSKTTSLELIRLADSLQVHIFPVGFGYTNDTTMMQLAEFTGGKYYKAYSARQLRSVFEDIYRSLRNYYLVTYDPPLYEDLHTVYVNLSIPQAGDKTAYAEYDKGSISGRLTGRGAFDTTFNKNVLFDFSKATIRPESYAILDEIARQLKKFPRVRLGVHGHTDNVGGEEFNQKLSIQRAEAVVEALVGRGIDRSRLRPRGFGMLQPLAPNDVEENRQKNRRTEFVILAR
jgi:VWFA-related protein